jgi:hypothetical protein
MCFFFLIKYYNKNLNKFKFSNFDIKNKIKLIVVKCVHIINLGKYNRVRKKKVPLFNTPQKIPCLMEVI